MSWELVTWGLLAGMVGLTWIMVMVVVGGDRPPKAEGESAESRHRDDDDQRPEPVGKRILAA